MKKILLKICPYIISLAIGLSFFFLSFQNYNVNLINLFVNFSAIFISITLIYLFYDLIKLIINRKLNKEIADYLKLQVDTIILRILNYLLKITYGYCKEFSDTSIKELLSIKKDILKNNLKDQSFLGFQILKNTSYHEEELKKILSNNLLTNKSDNEQIISIIRILKNVYWLSNVIQKNSFNNAKQNNGKDIYKIIQGTKINLINENFPNRYILLEKIDNNKAIVRDFGDFSENTINFLLQSYNIKNEFFNTISDRLYDLIQSINYWIKLTGYEFIVEIREFKMKFDV